MPHIPWALAQLWQVPQAALPQQVPSTQLPDPHSLPALQAAPSAFFPQVPPPHTPIEQSSSPLQVCRQAFAAPSQVNGAQGCVSLGGQLPLPSQNAASDSWLPPPGQETARQMVLVPHRRQAPSPLQRPSLPQLLSSEGAQPPCGSLPPAGTLLQAPSDPGTAQLRQLWPQVELQQTPSTQKPEVHSAPSPQALPLALVPQRPLPSQRLGGWHWVSSVHDVKQSVPSGVQTRGAQVWVAPGTQLPAPSQVEDRVRAPALQKAARQVVPEA